MIVDKIEKFLRDNKDPIPQDLIDDYNRMVARSIQRQFVRRPHSPRGWRASMSWDCTRRLAYELNGMDPEPVEWNTLITFQQGEEREAMGTMWTRLAMPGRVVSPAIGGEQEEVSIVVAGQTIHGHVDMVVMDDDGNKIPVDWKTANGISYGEAKDANTNPNSPWWTKQRFNYLSQLRIYMEAMKSPYGIFAYVNKEAGALLEIHVKPDPTWRVEFEERLVYLRSHMDRGQIPPHPSWATPVRLPGANQRPDGTKGPVDELIRFPCGYCKMKAHCFPGFEVVPLAAGPKFRRAVSA